MLEGTVPADYYLPEELPLQEYADWQFADRWGWPPQVVDEIPAKRADGLLAMDDLMQQIRGGRAGHPHSGRGQGGAGGADAPA